MMRRRLVVLATVSVILATGAVACTSGGSSSGSVSGGSHGAGIGSGGPSTEPSGFGGRTAGAGARRFVGETDHGTVIDFSVVLRLERPRAMQRFLEEVSDPSSPMYGKYLEAGEFGRRFGQSAGEVARVRDALDGAGFDVESVFPERTSITLSGPAGLIDGFFSTRLGDFRDRDGRRYVAPLSEPVVPSTLRPSVSGVAGLNGLPAPLPLAIPRGEGLFPDDAANAYNATPLRANGILGQNQTIAVVSFGSFRDKDVEAFDQEVGLDSGPASSFVKHVAVDGGTNDKTGEISQEVNLDIDVVHGMAPEAQILNYEAPLTSTSSFIRGLGDIMHKIVADKKADIASISYGLCDATQLEDGSPFLSPADRAFAEGEFAAARAAGISTFIAAGDSGAFGCQRFDLNDISVTPLWPGDGPNVISVGGTLLAVRQDGTYLQEAGWEDVLSQGGTGGGVNPQDPMPSFQQVQLTVNGAPTPVLDSARNPNSLRQGPDVAASADPDSGFFTVSAGKNGQSVGGPVGGTSAATPFWAASMLLIRQFAEQQGAGKLGFAGDLLYRVAQQHMNYDGIDAADEPFHDVVLGGNRKDDCRVGWDFATGLGSPNVDVLARDIVDLLRLSQPSG